MLEVALIAMARKVIIEEPNTVSSLTLLGIAALILALPYCVLLRAAGEEGTDPRVTRTVETKRIGSDRISTSEAMLEK